MTTVVVNGRFLSRPVTGVQRYARELLAALDRTPPPDIRLVLAAPRGSSMPSYASIEGFVDGSPLRGHAWEQLRLPALLRRLGGDLLWSPCNTGPVTVRRQAVTLCDAAVFAGPRWFSLPFRSSYRLLHRLLGRVCGRVLTISEFSRRELARYGVVPLGNVRVVPAGVDADFFSAAPKTAPGGYVLSVGSRDPRKDLKTLLKAWSLMPREGAGRTLLVAGGGGTPFAPERAGDVPGGVRFLGRVADADLPGLYAGAAALVAPSLYEGFDLPPLEAMAAGTPVLASDIPVHREVCGDAAAYFPPGDPAGLAAALSGLLADPGRAAALRASGRRRASEFSWSFSAAALVGALREAA